MKRLILLAAMANLFTGNAQNREIKFETGNLASVFEKAKKENKLIFVDAYTTWCGPCKQMAKYIFTQDSVADFYNTNFVNYKMDMEKGEGIEFAKKYEIGCYPNLLFINANGQAVNRTAGSMPANLFIEFGKNSMTPGKTFFDTKAAFEKQGINESNVIEYVNLIAGKCLDANAAVNSYFKTVKEEDLTKRINWILMRDYMYDHSTREMKYLTSNIALFEKNFGKDTVEQKISQLGYSYFMKYARSGEFDKVGYENAKKEFKKLQWPNSEKIIYDNDLNIYARFDRAKYYTLASDKFMAYNGGNASALNGMAWDFYENVSDKNQLKAAVAMSKRACELDNSYANLDTYAALLYKTGNYNEAETMALKSIEKAKAANMAEEDYKDTKALLNKIQDKKKGK